MGASALPFWLSLPLDALPPSRPWKHKTQSRETQGCESVTKLGQASSSRRNVLTQQRTLLPIRRDANVCSAAPAYLACVHWQLVLGFRRYRPPFLQPLL